MIDEIYNYRQDNLPIVEISTEWSKLCIPFEKSLTEEQFITFHKLLDIQSETVADKMRSAYKAGFKDGVALMTEVQRQLFLSAFKDKLSQKIDVKGEKLSYEQLISSEVWNLRGIY